MINTAFNSFIKCSIESGILNPSDKIWAENLIASRLGLDEVPTSDSADLSFVESLSALSGFAAEKGIIEDTSGERDIFETELAGLITPPPSVIIEKFKSLYEKSPRQATDWFYSLCRNNNYIRVEDIAKNIEYTTDTEFGALEITINLSKPEKDPRDIARAAKAVSANYPKCALCPENEGYKGRSNHPPRANLRIIPLTLQGDNWGFQYSPYAYFNEHSIVLSFEHRPMAIHKKAFANLFDFIDIFPEYFIGSNADLPIVGGSILSHEHYQCGRHTFPMMKAEIELPLEFKGYEDLICGKVNWPMPCIRIEGGNREKILDLADKILLSWRGYTDEEAYVFAETDGIPHNTVTPIAYKKNGNYILDLVLRNNITTDECPMGLYHPHTDKHNIKKENIGLIEVMGMAILPARLKGELEEVERIIQNGENPLDNPKTAHHAEWIKEYELLPCDNLSEKIRNAVGKTFAAVLLDAGVYKPCENEAFLKFIKYVNKGAVAKRF